MRMGTESHQQPETRFGLREGHKFPVRMSVRQSPSSPSTMVHGVSKDLTQTGMRVRVSGKVVIGARCRVQFVHCAGRVIPENVGATVRNAKRVNDREFEVGVQFDGPIHIKQPGKI